MNTIEWGEYKIGGLFEIRPTKAYKMTNYDLFVKDGMYPVVTNSSNNNGITGYTNFLPTERGNMITYSDTTTSDGIFYQPKDYVGYSHVQGFYPLSNKDKWDCYSLIYIVTAMKKAAFGKYSYGNKFNRENAKKLVVKLPTKNKEIDFEFIENFILAIEKLIIKDVVKYAEKNKEAVNQIIKNRQNLAFNSRIYIGFNPI